MKKNLLWLLVFLLVTQNLFGQRQMNYWALPPYKIDFTESSPTTDLLPAYNTAEFYGLSGLAFDNSGNLIVAGYQDHSIRKVNPSGIVSTIAGNGTSGLIDATGSAARFNLPAAVVLDAAQNIYIADNGNHCIRKITPAGVVITFAGSGTAGSNDGTGTAAQFNNPYGMAIDASGNLYVADSGNNLIRKITSSGVVTTIAGNTTPGYVDGTGTAARFYLPVNITLDVSGNFFITDNRNHRIRKMTSAGVVSTVAGSGSAGYMNGTGVTAQFNRPYGIVVDAFSNLYVTDTNNGVIRKITSSGVVSTYAGTGTPGFADGPAANAQFQWPTGLTINASGDLYEADNETHRVRKVTPAGIVSTFAGNGNAGFANTAALSEYAVSNGAFDENGNVLFTVTDDEIRNAAGISVGTLANYTLLPEGHFYGTLGKEISIVPVPGSCRDFYILYLKYGSSIWHQSVYLLSAKVSVSIAGVVTIVNNGTVVGMTGGNFMSFAVSKLNSIDNTRNLFAIGDYILKKYTISSSGISAETSILSVTPSATKVLELNDNGDKLAWIEGGISSSTASIHIYNVLLDTEIKKNISIPYAYYYGIEFSPDENYIYFSVLSYPTSLGGIYKVPATGLTGSVTPIQITSGSYMYTELELGRDGFIYAVDGLPSTSTTTSSGILGKINSLTDAVTAVNIPVSSAKYVGLLHGDFYMLPDQIDGENYDYFFGTPQLTHSFKINGTPVSPAVATNTFTCAAIVLQNTASAATAYQITINKADANGNVVSGYSYTTGLIASAPPSTIDLKALDAAYLASATGYFKIQFFTQNACTSSTYIGLIQNSTISAASANFKLNDGDGHAFSPDNTLPGDTLSASGGSISGHYSTGYIATYEIKVDKVDCSTGSVLTANVVNVPATAVTNGDPSTITAVSFNLKSTPKNYFFSNAGCFKVTYTVTNACGSSSQTGYFNSDPALFRIGNNLESTSNANNIYPNPTKGLTTVVFLSKEERIVTCALSNIQGGNVLRVVDAYSASTGINEMTFDTTNIPAGIYLYQLLDGTNTIQTGKLVITK
ncbi:T9SS type A sorting domain-containing protein [Cytophaga hutchinsonii]|uniref:Secretion system C-terminal sorting domain-containing protein n=1 Tax=Cytophaga hutchinsonii (strain ATCC 33406 / DSM 1761 / CIP 103989 / NBRC 15051 / NCIMB 9469 / D465) TaxID=269798 RepID=A0A6N4SU80_CYTH3|nr:T9SS type A sorting domain-containing protein [Cytophaga hutchinsonii]ABG60028.1 conserved hypothetical protein [Cytophaga hutchinsonii ATCC 33406]SFX25440.1 Por secretion system C-terminal sorting domain-containing protein [Cytophaga hutchinsonii ATCC 33406]